MIERDSGHVFSARYGSSPVTTDAYFLDSLLEVFDRDRETARRRLESFVSDGIAAPAAVA